MQRFLPTCLPRNGTSYRTVEIKNGSTVSCSIKEKGGRNVVLTKENFKTSEKVKCQTSEKSIIRTKIVFNWLF
jgi:hypothetical protein